MMKTGFIFSFSAFIVTCLMPIYSHAQFGGGSGTSTNPYLISSAEHLNNIRGDYLSSHFKQIANIDLDEMPFNSGNGWNPITIFRGKYDGNGYLVSGLYINRPATSRQGLFGSIRHGGRVANLGVISASVTGGDRTAILAGEIRVNSYIFNCFSTGNVVGKDNVGGLVGYLITYGTDSPQPTIATKIENSYSTASVSAESRIGGLVGALYRLSQHPVHQINNCYSTGPVIGPNNDRGGLIGRNVLCEVNRSYWNRHTSGQTTSAGGSSRTTLEMKYPYSGNTYESWNFSTIWEADVHSNINEGYPFFHWLSKKGVFTLTYGSGENGTVDGSLSQTVVFGDSGSSVLAVPNPGYRFEKWSDNSTENPRTDSNVSANINVTAQFALNQYSLVYSTDANGSIQGETTQTVAYGDSGTEVRAIANEGHRFKQWSDGSTENPRTDHDVTEDINVVALFDPPENMVLIPAGSFEMGDSFEEGHERELPVRTLYVSAFYMDQYPVTKTLWEEVYDWALDNGYDFANPGTGKAPDHPVHTISWFDMAKWCNARSEKEGRAPAYYLSTTFTTDNVYRSGNVNIQNDWVQWYEGYRFPTEAEWDKAARGGTHNLRFPWGNTINHSHANYMANGADYEYDDSPYSEDTYHPDYTNAPTPYTSPVGSFPPNGFGLHDVVGNIIERCWDWNGNYSDLAVNNPRGPDETGAHRITRGSGWSNPPNPTRIASRGYTKPTNASIWYGFRTVLGSVPTFTLSVDSPHGVPQPAVGIQTNSLGTLITNSVQATTIDGGSQYVCTGWAMEGHEPTSGVTNQFTMTVTNDAVLVWLWSTNYWLDVKSGKKGNTDTTSQWVASGEQITLTATPDAGYQFSGWTGDIDGAEIDGNQITVTMDRPKTVLASFADTITISNFNVSQRPGTKLVDISYDVSSTGTNEVWVSLIVSNVHEIVATDHLEGDLGLVDTGNGKAIVWNAGADWSGNVAELTFGLAVDPYELPYLVIDLSEGPDAEMYPTSRLHAPPEGGWTDEYKTTKLVMRKIPAGMFMMGSPEDELGRVAERELQRQATLTKDYYIGVFPVTQRQWERVTGNWPSYFNNTNYRDARPVERVSYYEIRENPAPFEDGGSAISPNWPKSSQVHSDSFMGKLRAKTGLSTLDLPTEAQWERACRAGTTTALNSGKNLTNTGECPNMSEVGRYAYNGGTSGGAPPSDCNTDQGSPTIGAYVPNAWDLYDMHGTIHEWCLDWSVADPLGTIDPVGPISGWNRSGRGGGWFNPAWVCRSANRGSNHPSDTNRNVGFRLAKTLSSSTIIIGDTTQVSASIDTRDYELAVHSDYGSPSPAVGTHFYAWASFVNCSVDQVVQGNGTRWINIGWAGSGAIPETGDSYETGEIQLTEVESSITWLWSTNYWLETASTGQGVVQADEGWVAHGVEVEAQAVPTNGWYFTGWTGDVPAENAHDNPVRLTMDQPRSITAGFAINEYTLTYHAGAGGTILGDMSQTGEHGADGLEVTAAPDEGHHFVQWSDGVSTAIRRDTNLTANVEVTALFAINRYSLAVDSAHGEPTPPVGLHTNDHGTVLSNSVAGPIDAGLTQYEVAGWQMDGHDPASGVTNQFSMTVTNDATLAWLWSTNYWLEIIAGTNGSVDVESQWLASGEQITLRATPDAGYHFAGWIGDVDGTEIDGNQITVTMDQPKTIESSFAINQYELTVISSPEDGGIVTGGGMYAPGTEVQLIATPSEHYTFVGWNDNVPDASRWVTVPEGGATYTAYFNPVGKILSITPASGLWKGGYGVVIDGTNLCNGGDVTNVTLCGTSVSSIDSRSATQVVVTAAQGPEGVGDVRVFSFDYGETVASNAFEYLKPNHALRNFGVTNGLNEGFAFTSNHFINAYSDPEGMPLHSIRIDTLPDSGKLELSGVALIMSQQIATHDVNNLEWVAPGADWHGMTSFEWSASDGKLFSEHSATSSVVILRRHRPRENPPVPDYVTSPGALDTQIPLNEYVEAPEGGALRFEIVSVSNWNLFDSVEIDQATGVLTIDYASDPVIGDSSVITIRAIDEVGLERLIDFRVTIGETPTWGATPIHLNWQNGLFEQIVSVTNESSIVTAIGVRLVFTNITEGIEVYNSHGEQDDFAILEYYEPLPPGANTDLTVWYYTSGPSPIDNPPRFRAELIMPSLVHDVRGPAIKVYRYRRLPNNTMLIEFRTQQGRWYCVQYSESLASPNWKNVQPYLKAPADTMQWIDAGPPATTPHPKNVPNRFYRVIEVTP